MGNAHSKGYAVQTALRRIATRLRISSSRLGKRSSKRYKSEVKPRVKIVVNEIPPSNNEYMGKTYKYSVYQEEKKRWHWLIKAAIKRAEKPKKPIEKAIVNITYYFKTKTRRDPDNYSGKMLLDPLVREGILIDDSFDVVTLVLDAGYDKDNPRTEIKIRSVEDGRE